MGESMGVFDRMRQGGPMGDEHAVEDASQTRSAEDSQSALAPEGGFDQVRWRAMVETVLIGLGAAVLSVLVIWATVTTHLGVETILLLLVALVLAIVTSGQAMRYHRQSQALHQRTSEAAVKTTKAAEIMIEFLREFTLKNQETMSYMIESQKGRVIDELGKAVDDLARVAESAALRHQLTQLREMIGRKIMEIPSGVTFPVPRLERFDAADTDVEEPERIPPCPACGAAQARVSTTGNRSGLRYTCSRCGHEFTLGITVLLEKQRQATAGS